MRRVPTGSGATAVQIVHKRGRRILSMDHVGSARDEVELALLLQVAHERMHAGQAQLPLGEDRPGGRPVAGPVVTATPSLVLWDALERVYTDLGFDALGDRTFKQLVLGRIIEPTSKIDTLRVLEEVGVWTPSISTVKNALTRTVERSYRDTLGAACYAHAAPTGRLGAVLYDLTTLHFETPKEDSLRKVGMSKERRVDPQVTVGLLCDPGGFPLAVHLFEGNKAETKTLIPVLKAFQDAHDVNDMVVVADAGMLSAANLLALEDAGFSFIVGSRAAKTPYDLAEHFKTKGNHFADGQVLETTRDMGVGRDQRRRRVVYQYRFKRAKNDDRAINAMIKKAEDVASGRRPLKRDRFVRIDGATKGVDWDLVERARSLTGLKGYVTNIARERDGRCCRRGRLPGPLPGRTVLPDGQVRPESPPGLPPDQGLHRGPPDHRLRGPGDLTGSTAAHRGVDQEDPQHAAATALRRHHQRRLHDYRRARHPTRRSRAPQYAQPGWSLKVANSGCIRR